ncbi:TPA: hypothetical protein EYN98_11315 [Candidatus Poribacteria bacterium]|nr:hypothetical protein [Candidatus Poribacteria bacterium]HIA66626.1 hypothetical protein [Candidatus Poribacteria bacterium]HIB89673.1 hypothetical protein [Candidatus Poribacteria bacterium]HIC00218.1 hypothetical protein [Candidatus Poribacteria bacterium]HIN32097.1 hypothetical protein [Candidatus Poribacteria bacterium]
MRIIQLIVALLIVAGNLYLGQAQSINIVDENGKLIIRTDALLTGGTTYLSTEVLRLVFDTNLTQKYIPLTKNLTLVLREREIRLRINRTLIQIEPGGQNVSLHYPPLLFKRKLFLPIEFFTQLIPQVYGFDVSYNATLHRMQVIEKSSLFTDNVSGQFTAIIDLGHGGQDAGCRQDGILEKDVVLRLAKRSQIESSDKSITILLTRDSDTTLSAKDRIRFANRKKEAKLFISIHCNMSFSPERKGIEIYVNNTRSDLLKIGLDPDKNGNTNDQFILLKPLSQDHFLEESRQFAAILKNQFESVFSEKISMFELPLNMIQNIYMPAILVEVGYLSNPVDLKRLRGDQFLNQISVVVLRAIEKYQEKLTTENSLIERE